MVLLTEPLGNRKITMATLLEESGMKERQVRRCIAEGLVEGAIGKGQAARYSEATLQKLKLIRKLMEQEVQPFGRKPTLVEIKRLLPLLSKEQEEDILAGLPFSFIDTGDPDDAEVVDTRLDNEYLDLHEKAALGDSLDLDDSDPRSQTNLFRADASRLNAARADSRRADTRMRRRRQQGTTLYHGELGEFGQLLQMLKEKLDTLVDDRRTPDAYRDDSWVRVRTRSSVLEIHIKAPQSNIDRAQLKAVQNAVEELIRRGYDPY